MDAFRCKIAPPFFHAVTYEAKAPARAATGEVRDCDINMGETYKDAIVLEGGSVVRVVGNTFDGGANVGVVFGPGATAHIERNKFRCSCDAAISINARAREAVLVDNNLSSSSGSKKAVVKGTPRLAGAGAS